MTPRRVFPAHVAWKALAIATVIAVCWTSGARNASPVVRNVVIVTLDTTRADLLSAYGGTQVETPALDRLAREGVVFEQAMSTAPLTLPAHCSLFTGLFPSHHGVRDNVDPPLGDSYTTVAEVLRDNAVRSGAFVGSAVVGARRGLAQGFDTYSDGQPAQPNRLRRPADVVVDEAIDWITRHDASPFFTWVHLYDAHAPYALREPYRTMYEDVPYLGAIAYMDAQIERLRRVLEQRHRLDETLIVVAGDHGESLGEHGEDAHGIFLYQSTIRVPMIVRAPGVRPKRVKDVVRLVDVMPTVLDVLRVRQPPMDGTSLVPIMTGRIEHLDLDAYAESLYPRRFGWGSLHALRAGRFKLVNAPQPELYDLEKDPGEQHNIYHQRNDLGAVMSAALNRMALDTPGDPAAAATRPDSESIERLAALGYVSPSPTAHRSDPARQSVDPRDCISVYNEILRARGASPVARTRTVNAASAFSGRRLFGDSGPCASGPLASSMLSGPFLLALEPPRPPDRTLPAASR